MNKLSVNAVLGGVNVICDFEAGLNSIDLFKSGSGKTFLFSLLKAYMLDNNITFKAFNYDSSSVDVTAWLNGLDNNGGVAVLDNADLYLEGPLREVMVKTANTVIFIISIKNDCLLPKNCKLRKFRLDYHGTDLICTEV